MSQTLYTYDPDTGVFTGVSVADESPLEPGVFLIPSGATPVAPPEVSEGQRAVFHAGAWTLEDLPPEDADAEAEAPTLAQRKAAKNLEINAARATANSTTFAHDGYEFSCDGLSRGDIDGINGYVALNAALPPSFLGAWKAADNRFYPIADVAGWKAFYASMVAAGAAHFAHSEALKQALAATTTAEEVAAIVW